MIKIESKNLIVKSNNLIEANYRLSAGEQKILYKLITSIKKDDLDFKEYEFKVSEFLELLEINNPRKYKDVQKITYSLIGKRISIYNEELKKLTQVTWLAQAEYYEHQGMVKLAFAPALKPYLLQLKGNFTRFEVQNLMRLRSGYAMRLYELLYQYMTISNRTFKMEELRDKLGILEKEYKLYGDFKRKVILQAQKEINEKTDMYFEFEEIKGVRKKITGIKFLITHNTLDKENNIPNSSQEEIAPAENEPVKRIKEQFKILYKGNLMDKFIKNMIDSKGNEHIQKCLNDYSKYIHGRKVANIAGDFYTFVMNGYEKPVNHNGNIPSYANFEQREYDDDDYEKFYANITNKG